MQTLKIVAFKRLSIFANKNKMLHYRQYFNNMHYCLINENVCCL